MPQYQGVWTLPVAARLQSNQQWVTDPLYRNTTLLLQADNAANGAQNNTFLDSSSNNFTITRNGNTTQGTFTPFSQSPGWWSNFFDGSGDYLTAPNSSAFALPGDFTIELWVNFSSNTTSVFCGNINNAGAGDWALFYNNALGIRFITDNAATVVTGNYIFTPGVWTHVAVSRSGTNLRIFANGQVLTTVTNSSSNSFAGTMQIGRANDGNLQFPGYMSNLRIVKGTAFYTGNFTPSPIPLTAITNTSLLTCQSNRFVDNSTNNFAITRFGDTSVQAFSPFAPQYQYTPSVTGGSGYFDGTGDYLNLAVQSFTGDFTVEAWIYPTRLNDSGGSGQIFSYDVINIQFYIDGSGNLNYYNNSITTSTTAAISLNSWQHVALCRSGSTTRIFVNGTLRATNASDSGTRAFSAIGQFASGGAYLFQGYMSSVRWAATAVYTSNFTPPTAPLTAITNTQLLLNFTNAGIYDGTLKNNLETVGNAQISTAVVKYGTGSMYFDGTGDYLSCPAANAGMNPQTGDFTIECWVWIPSLPGAEQAVVSTMTGGGTGVLFGLAGGGNVNKFQIGIGNLSVSNPTVVDSSTFPVQTWTHVAAVRRAGVLYLYKNGVSVGTPTAATGSISQATLTVGAWSTGGAPFNGYLDDVRITAGIARYTANFTPPTVALPRQ